MTDITVILWGVLVRTAQAFVEAAPTIVCGVLVAGILRYMVGAAGVRRAFGAKGWRGVFRGWAFGMLLPVCSVGVIPVARELLRCGVGGGTVIGFVLAAPLLNPISFLYGLTLSEPTVILVFTAASLLLALAMGGLWERLAPSEEVAPAADEPLPPPGVKRLIAVAVGSAREACGPVLLFALVAVVGSGLLAVIPCGSLQALMPYADRWAPVQMVGLAVPAFNSPLNGMMKLGLMFDHGNSVAAAFVLFVLGLGTSFGLIAWVATLRGWRPAAKWFGATVLATLLVGYALQGVLPKPARTEDHTHAFDEFSNPFMAGHGVGVAEARAKIVQKAEGLELIALPTLAGFVLVGLIDRRARRRFDLDAWLVKAPAASRVSKYDVVLPGPVVGLIALAGLVVFSVVGAYTYYPPPKQALDEVNRLRAEVGAEVPGAANPDPTRAARHRAAAIRNIELLDLAVRKLMVGVYIREYRLAPEQSKAAEDLRENLEHMRDALLAGKPDEAARLRPAMLDQHRALSAAFAPAGPKNAE